MRNLLNQMHNQNFSNQNPFSSTHYKQQQSYQQYQRQQQRSQQHNSTMTRAEALDILGLPNNASDVEIREAYQKLIKMVHPDKGGSPYLTQKLNQAKEVLLG